MDIIGSDETFSEHGFKVSGVSVSGHAIRYLSDS